MYTQCSKCETVFKLSADALRAAGGQVRCGRCGEVFNALARLAEDSSGFMAGESAIDMEERAASILESNAAPDFPSAPESEAEPDDAQVSGVEVAHLRIVDFGEQSAALSLADMQQESSMEFTLPPGELDRIFVETKLRAPVASPIPTVALAPSSPASATSPATPGSPAPFTAAPAPPPPPHPESTAAAKVAAHKAALAKLAAARSAAARAAQAGAPAAGASSPAARQAEEDEDLNILPSLEVISDNRRRRGGAVVSDQVRRELLSASTPAVILEAPAPLTAPLSAGRRRAFWLAACALAALTLLAQAALQNRESLAEWLAAHAWRSAHAGLPNLAAYQLRQWGVTGDPAADGTLRVRASILNSAAQLEPYPLLRVTLANRFGSRIGARDFEPAEYMGKPTARLLAPNETIDVTLTIMDPGKNAEGFEIDICLRATDQRINCAGDAATAAQSKK